MSQYKDQHREIFMYLQTNVIIAKSIYGNRCCADSISKARL